jgi:hypothetical protein
VDSHSALHIIEAVWVLGDLQTRPLIPRDPLLLHTEHLGEVCVDSRDEGGSSFGGRPRTAWVVGRETLHSEIPARRRHLGAPDTRASVAQAPAAGQNKTRGGRYHINRTCLQWEKEDISIVA